MELKEPASHGMAGTRVRGAFVIGRELEIPQCRDLEYRLCSLVECPRRAAHECGISSCCVFVKVRECAARGMSGSQARGCSRGSERISGTRDGVISSKGRARNRPTAVDSAGCRDLEHRACSLLDYPRRAVHECGILSCCVFVKVRECAARGMSGSQVMGCSRGSERISGTRDGVISSKGRARIRPRAGDSAGCRDFMYRACSIVECLRRAHEGGISSCCVFVEVQG